MNLKMNNLFLFETIFFEISSSQYIVFNSRNVNCFVVIVVLYNMNFAYLMNSFTTIIIMSYVIFVVKFFDFESFVMKFNAMFWYDRFIDFNDWNLFICSKRSIFVIAYFKQFFMYFSTCFFNICMFVVFCTLLKVLITFWCFDVFESWACRMTFYIFSNAFVLFNIVSFLFNNDLEIFFVVS